MGVVTSGFHRGGPRLHHRGPSGVTHHVSWFTHGRTSHVHRRSSHVRRGASCHWGHMYRWCLVGWWSSHVSPTKDTKSTKKQPLKGKTTITMIFGIYIESLKHYNVRKMFFFFFYIWTIMLHCAELCVSRLSCKNL